MIHAIVYAKQHGVLDFHQSTPGFPREYLSQIHPVCQRAGAGFVLGQREYALRYAPLGDLGMLHVMVCNHGNEKDEQRLHWNVVTYLLDQWAAFHFFLLPFRVAQRNALELTRNLLQAPRSQDLPANLERQLLASPNVTYPAGQRQIPDQVLLRAAFYGRGELKNDRLFIQVPGDPTWELERMFDAVPPFLRWQISFHTGVYAPEDSHGVSICCCPPPVLERLEFNGFNGCESSNIFYHYPQNIGNRNRIDNRSAHEMDALLGLRDLLPRYDILKFAITDWDTFQKLADLHGQRNALRKAMRLLKDPDLERALNIARNLNLEPLSQQELKQFLSASRGKNGTKEKLRLLKTPTDWRSLLTTVGSIAALPAAILLQWSMASSPVLWKSILAMILAFLSGFGLRGLFASSPRSAGQNRT